MRDEPVNPHILDDAVEALFMRIDDAQLTFCFTRVDEAAFWQGNAGFPHFDDSAFHSILYCIYMQSIMAMLCRCKRFMFLYFLTLSTWRKLRLPNNNLAPFHVFCCYTTPKECCDGFSSRSHVGPARHRHD